MDPSTAAPAPPLDRLSVLDALRGFALLGILLANALGWAGWLMVDEAGKVAWAGETTALWQYRLHHLLVDGKFYTLFSLLFGLGFALILERMARKGHDGLRIYRRRILVLLGIGLVHCFLVWDGDILVLYALIGLLLPLFHRWRTRSLVLAGLALVFVVPPLGIALFEALGWAPHAAFYGLTFAIGEAMGADIAEDQVIAWLRREDLMGWLSWQLSAPWYSWGLRLESWRIPKVLGIMLIGMAAGRGVAAGTLLEDRRLLKAVLAAGLAIGVPASVAYAWTPGQGQGDWSSLVGTVPLALAYAAAFALAWPSAQRWLGVFAAPGRMALTNYLLQSLVGILLFHGYGLGLWGMGRAAQLLLVLLVFAAQVAASHWWLRRFRYGPVEWLWRSATYLRFPPMRRARALPA